MINTEATDSGKLYVVATPIGNLEDISLRALATLKAVDFIIAEDTRHSAQLLNHYAIKKPLTSLHSFNEAEKSNQLIQRLKKGESAALISDAGTPLINDPGFPLVKLAREHQISVSPIPGACALIAALSAAGIACDQFSFMGFLPPKQAARMQKLAEYKAISHTLVFYEAKHRIIETVLDIATCFGAETELVLVKELSKTHETFLFKKAVDLAAWLEADAANQKGEFILMIPPRTEHKDETELIRVLTILLEALPLKQASKIASQLTGVSKNSLYELALSWQKG